MLVLGGGERRGAGSMKEGRGYRLSSQLRRESVCGVVKGKRTQNSGNCVRFRECVWSCRDLDGKEAKFVNRLLFS